MGVQGNSDRGLASDTISLHLQREDSLYLGFWESESEIGILLFVVTRILHFLLEDMIRSCQWVWPVGVAYLRWFVLGSETRIFPLSGIGVWSHGEMTTYNIIVVKISTSNTSNFTIVKIKVASC